MAVAQSTVPEDPTEPANLRASGAEIRGLMRAASEAGARLVQFPEGAVTYPGKRVMSAGGRDRLDASDEDINVALRHARPWRRVARAGLYDDRIVRGDPRSESQTTF